MLLTRKSNTADRSSPGHVSSGLSSSLANSLARALPTMDRRGFLKRSGIGIGAGIAVTQLGLIQKARADESKAPGAAGGKKLEVKRTVCTHCSVGCASMPSSRTACGFARSRCSIRRSISARTAPRVLHCASTATANTV